jgi:hypothetical protein
MLVLLLFWFPPVRERAVFNKERMPAVSLSQQKPLPHNHFRLHDQPVLV